MTPPLKPLEPRAPRWEPSNDPHSIVVPGLDTTASLNDQIEQIEQLITLKLQGIDANFSKIQQVMASKVLPAVKRYAVGTEPVREAAKFWTTFYEEAAQIRFPTYDEYVADQTETDQESDSRAPEDQSTDQSGTDQTPTHSHSFNPDGTSSEVSFMPAQAAGSSTPARYRSQHDIFLSNDDATPSWSGSLESPLVRLDREIQSLGHDEISLASSSVLHQDSQYDETQEVTQRQIPRPTVEQPSYRDDRSGLEKGKGKAREPDAPLLQGVLRRNADSSVRSRNTTMVSPLKVKGKTPIIKRHNPYISADANPLDWKGVVDLKDPTVTTPRKTPYSTKKKKSATPRATPAPAHEVDDDIDSSLGMSPPVMLAFAKLPKAQTPQLGRTPRKAAAERIMKNLVDLEKRGFGGKAQQPSTASGYTFSRPGPSSATETSMSSAPTPPSLSRYTHQQLPSKSEVSTSIADASLESMMRRVGLSVAELNYKPGSSAAHDASTSSSIPSMPRSSAFTRPPMPEEAELETPPPPVLNFSRLRDDEIDNFNNNNDDSSDSLDYEEANTANPSAAFLFASQQASYNEEDSFSSGHSDDSLADEGDLLESAQHPFAGQMVDGDDFDDDSFDDPQFGNVDTEEETLFGVPPAQRLVREAEMRRRSSNQQMRMMGEELLEDTLGIGAQRARAGIVDESPGPWGR